VRRPRLTNKKELHMKIRLLTAMAVMLSVTMSVVVDASPAFAVAPGNDDIAGAQSIGPLPYHFEENTNEATTSADEAAVQSSCPVPHIDHGVWFTAGGSPDPVVVKVDATHSDYSVGIAVFSGSPGSLSFLGCVNGGFQAASGPPGTTFYMLLFGDGGWDGNQPTSGNLVLDVRLVVAPPVVTFTFDKFASVDKGDVLHLVHVSGTVTCTTEDGQGVVTGGFVILRQDFGRFTAFGSGGVDGGQPCDGVPHAWTSTVYPYVPGPSFSGGKVGTLTEIDACGTDQCSFNQQFASFQLRRNG